MVRQAGKLPPRGAAKARLEPDGERRGRGRGLPGKPPAAASGSRARGGFFTDKQRRRCGGWEAGDGEICCHKREREIQRGRPRECETEKPGEEFSAVRAAIKEYDRYKTL